MRQKLQNWGTCDSCFCNHWKLFRNDIEDLKKYFCDICLKLKRFGTLIEDRLYSSRWTSPLWQLTKMTHNLNESSAYFNTILRKPTIPEDLFVPREQKFLRILSTWKVMSDTS